MLFCRDWFYLLGKWGWRRVNKKEDFILQYDSPHLLRKHSWNILPKVYFFCILLFWLKSECLGQLDKTLFFLCSFLLVLEPRTRCVYSKYESVYFFSELKLFESFFCYYASFQSDLTLYIDCKYFHKMNIIFKMHFLQVKIKPLGIE